MSISPLANCLRYFPSMKNFVVLIHETVHVVESVCDSANVDIESDGTTTAGETATISETDFSPCNPQANSTVLDTFPIESGYVTKGAKRRIYL